MNWNEFAKEVHQVAVEHGWWEKRPSFADMVVMFHSELSEAVEEYRNGRPMVYCEGMNSNAACWEEPCGGMECLRNFQDRKPEGVAVELADCILRILDTLAEAGVDIDAEITYPVTGDGIIEIIARSHRNISEAYATRVAYDGQDGYSCLVRCVGDIMGWAIGSGVDMEAILRAKHEYNKIRPYRHGGKVL